MHRGPTRKVAYLGIDDGIDWIRFRAKEHNRNSNAGEREESQTMHKGAVRIEADVNRWYYGVVNSESSLRSIVRKLKGLKR